MAPTIAFTVGSEHDVYVLNTALTWLRDEYINRSTDPLEPTGAPFLEWAAAAENLRLQLPDEA